MVKASQFRGSSMYGSAAFAMRASALTVGSFVLGLGTALLPAPAHGQAAGQSISRSSVTDISLSGTQSICFNLSPSGPSTSASCPVTAITGGAGSASAVSNNALRTVSASATATGSGGLVKGQAQGLARQASALAVTGTPSGGDQLLFHFLTTQCGDGRG